MEMEKEKTMTRRIVETTVDAVLWCTAITVAVALGHVAGRALEGLLPSKAASAAAKVAEAAEPML